MTQRICPECKRKFGADTEICPDCGHVLIGIDQDFDMVMASMKNPILLTNDAEKISGYLEEALKKRRISFFIESGQNLEYTYGGIKGGSVQPVFINSYYVDESDWEEACEAFDWAVKQYNLDNQRALAFKKSETDATGETLVSNSPDHGPVRNTYVESEMESPERESIEREASQSELPERESGQEIDDEAWLIHWFCRQPLYMKMIVIIIFGLIIATILPIMTG